jgi:hypothetical protein
MPGHADGAAAAHRPQYRYRLLPDRAVLLLEKLPPHRPRPAFLPRRGDDAEGALKAQVFFCFDTLLPRYQWRHKAKEVEGWLVEEGLDPLLRVHSFYAASSVPVT